jgi:quinolinate synthase
LPEREDKMRDESQELATIRRLKQEKQAVILAHNYQLPEVQDIADFVGDSLDLSQQAAETDARVIVFCGVHFMAETAAILSPDKTVLLPDTSAGCPMANMITADELRKKKRELPGVPVVCYVNSPAEVKAESDVCCTSANAVSVVNSLAESQVLFVPDRNLGHYVSTKSTKRIYFWPGFCPAHDGIRPDEIESLKRKYPAAKVIVHPECRPEVVKLADEVLSTSGMLRFARTTGAKEIIVGTEVGILYRLGKENPTKKFIPVSAVCPDMKRINLAKIAWSLENLATEVKVPEPVRLRAKRAVDRMLAIRRAD